MHPESRWTVVTLCRKSDPDRMPRFFRALQQLNATGAMGDLDDGPQQTPLDERKTQDTIIELLTRFTANRKSLMANRKSRNETSDMRFATCDKRYAIRDKRQANCEFDLIITHGLQGEYTRHLRHEETAKSVLTLWKSGRLSAATLWMFAYQDGGRKYLPRPVDDPDVLIKLPEEIWQKKYDIITKIYGFSVDTFEAKTTPRQEAFKRLIRYKVPKVS